MKIFTSYLSTVTLIFFVSMTFIKCDECPPNEKIEPCSCKIPNEMEMGGEITCKNMYTADQLSRVLRSTQGYNTRKLILLQSSMQYIPNSIFEDLRFKTLVFTNDIFNQLFDGVPKDPGVVSFRFTQVKIEGSFDWTPFSGFTRLKFIHMHQVILRGLTSFKQKAPKSLEDITFDECDIRKLRKDEFQDFSKLKRIEVTKDKIKKLKRSMFPRPSVLDTLIFKDNQISNIPEDLFEDMKLELLELSNNQITVLPENTYKPILNALLVVEGNPLKCDCGMKWVPEARHKISASILGECDSPQLLVGKALEDLVEGDFAYC